VHDTQITISVSGSFSIHNPQSLVLCEFPKRGKQSFTVLVEANPCRNKKAFVVQGTLAVGNAEGVAIIQSCQQQTGLWQTEQGQGAQVLPGRAA